jgi:hypothetical protein
VNGKWRKSSEDPKEILEQEAEARKHGTATCQIVREETVDGQPASVYCTAKPRTLRKMLRCGLPKVLAWR